MPKLSIITINLNNKEGLQKTMASVISQTFTDYEYIVIDGGSTDGSLDMIKGNADKISNWVSEPDKGIYDAMNKALKLARGTWINFLNSGDSYYNSETIAKIFENEIPPIFDALLGNVVVWNNNKSTIFDYHKFIMRINYRYCHQAVFIRTNCHRPFDTNYKIVADLDILIEFINKNRVKFINEIVVNFDESGISRTNLSCLYNERKKIIQKKGIWYLIPIEMFSYFKFRLFHLLGRI